MRSLLPLLPLLLVDCGDKADDDTGSTAADEDSGGADGTSDDGSGGDDGDDGGGDDGGGGGDDSGDDGSGDDDSGDDGTGPEDADGDGFDATEDCDDTDASVFPGADETCNGVDDDCDEEIDEDPVDAGVYYEDRDGDGFGDAGLPTIACAVSEGIVADATDCDDEDGAVHPGATEVGCDGIDNDCDGSIDANRVPTDFDSLLEAVEGLSDGAEICVEPGTYTEQLDLSGRTLRITGQAGAASTVLDVGSSTPMISIVGASETFGAGDITLSGFTVTGADVSAATSDVLGAFAYVEGGTLSMSDVEVSALSGVMSDGHLIEGLFVYGLDSSLSLRDVSVDDVSFFLDGESGDDDFLTGGIIRTVRGELDIETLTVTGLSVRTDPDRARCYARGVVLALDDSGYLGGATDGDAGTAFSISDLEVRDTTLTIECAERVYAGTLAWVENAPGTLVGFTATGSVIEANAEADATATALLYGWFPFDEWRGDFSVMDLSDNSISAEGTSSVTAMGPVSTDGADLSHVRVWDNTLGTGALEGDSASTGALVEADEGEVSHLDVRGNHIETRGATQSLVQVESVGEARLSNFVIAGNTALGGEIRGGALSTFGEEGTVTVRNGDIVGNVFSGVASEYGNVGIVEACQDAESGVLLLTNLQIIDNIDDDEAVLPALYTWEGDCAGAPTASYLNIYGQEADTELGAIVGSDGNISQDPLYTDVSSADPAAWDLSLGSGSPAVDAGDPSITDDDGTTSDLGAYGGPGGTSW